MLIVAHTDGVAPIRLADSASHIYLKLISYFVQQQESDSSGTPQREVAAEGEVDLDGSYLETIEKKKKSTPRRTSTPDHKSTIEQLR